MSHFMLNEFVEHNNINVDKFYLDIVLKDKWIYVNNELLKSIGCEIMQDLSMHLSSGYFTEDVDYKFIEASKLDDSYAVFGGSNETLDDAIRYVIVVSSICFRDLLILIGTSRAKQVYRTYLHAEKIYKRYVKYIEQSKHNDIKKLEDVLSLTKRSYFKRDQYLYVITNTDDAAKNIFRLAFAVSDKDLPNTNDHTSSECVYVLKCVDALSLYRTLLIWLAPFIYDKSHSNFTLIQLHFDTLKNLLSIFENSESELFGKINELYFDYSTSDIAKPVELKALIE